MNQKKEKNLPPPSYFIRFIITGKVTNTTTQVGNDLQLVLLVGGGEEVINQAHSKHRDTRLLHQHGTGPQKQTEQQEEGRSCRGKALPGTALIQTPAKQVGHFLINTWVAMKQSVSFRDVSRVEQGSKQRFLPEHLPCNYFKLLKWWGLKR